MSYTGKCLYIDLTTSKYKIKDTEKELLKKYIGGKGLGFALLSKLAKNPDPLSPENPLIFLTGPFTGTKIQTSGRSCLVTRSPLTGSIHDSHCGGHFGPRIKAAGFDYIYISGAAEKPTYLNVTDNEIEFLDATPYWGKGIFETNDAILSNHKGIDPRAAIIGPAGENKSFMACIGVDKHRQYGRGGVGAVMGSKNLKAIIADGSNPIEYNNTEEFNYLNKKLTKDILNHDGVKFRRDNGTMKCVLSGQENEFLPTKNFQECLYDDYEGLISDTCRKELNWKDTGCFNCAIRCSKIAKWDNHELEGPEYETAAYLGSGCLISDCRDVTWANEICNDLGFDTISVGVTCSFAMECYEKDLLKDWEGLEMTWGNAEMQREFINRLAYRKGIANIFADGTRVAANKIGQGSSDFAINVFGMEISGVNPKGSLTMGVSLSTSDFASHTRLWCTEKEMGPDFTIEDMPSTVVEGQDDVNIRNSLIICDFVPFGLDRLLPILNATSEINFTMDDIMKVGKRISALARIYNLENGRSYKDDILPERFFKEKSLSGFARDEYLDKDYFKALVGEVYSIRGWDKKGVPTKETLSDLDI